MRSEVPDILINGNNSKIHNIFGLLFTGVFICVTAFYLNIFTGLRWETKDEVLGDMKTKG